MPADQTTDLSVGQKLWFVPDRHFGQPREVTVLKIGRKWAAISERGDRIDIETLVVDGKGYSSPGRCYRSREGYETIAAANAAWDALMRDLRNTYQRPRGLTVEDIEQARRILLQQEGASRA